MSRATSVWSDARNILRGALMGGADVVPGVSGGTVALIVGIYDRLVTAISHVDRTFLGHLYSRQWQAAAERIDLRFLLTLGLGIGMGVVALGGLVNHLLTNPVWRAVTLAFFFGSIFASALLVGRMISVDSRRERIAMLCLAAAGFVFAYYLTGLRGSQVEPSLAFVFFCGFVGICAMILPGVSGAHLLLMLGVYIYLTDILKRLPKLQVDAHDALVVVVFGGGCLFGLLAFSKVLRWLLQQHRSPTMAILCGFMLGALRKVWPFQHDLTPEIEAFKEKAFQNVLPTAWNAQAGLCLGAALLAIVGVFLLDRAFRASADQTP